MITVWLFLQLLAFASCVSVEDFFPFGEAVGDFKVPNKKHAFGKVFKLNGTYSFYNTEYNALQVHGDGLITLGKNTFFHAVLLRHRKFPFPPNTPSIAVFYAPIEVKNASEVFYRETRNQSVIKWANDRVRSSFVKEKDFTATNVFIATWNNVVRADDRIHRKVNTFQTVLITDGKSTFSLFNYKDDGLQWVKGYHVQYQGTRFFDAQVGFSAGDQVRSYLLPGSGTKDVKLLSTKSNVQYSGQWMFKIGWPKMGSLNVEAADSFVLKDNERPLYFIVDQYFNGCFKVHGYLSSNASEIWQDVSIRSCMILCHERNHRYAALHDGSQCACLSEPDYSRLEKLPKEACDVRCAVNDEEFCGGKTTASVFWAVGGSVLSADERAAGLNDVDECDSGVSQCHSDATCKNTAPGYCCECNDGYFGNGVVCEREGTNLRFNGRLSGNINGIKFHALLLDVIAITKDGRVYAVMRNPPVGLAHSLKILTPFADVVGWMLGVQNVKGVPSGFTVIGNRFTRSAVISFDSGEELSLNQKFTGKGASGRFISVETTINGTMPNIRPDSSVRIHSFKEVYRREDPGRVESDGSVTFEVDGQANGFSVLQNIAYDELEGCDISFYSFDVESRILLSKFDEKQNYSGVAVRSFIVNASTPDTQGQQGNGNPCGSQKLTCHKKASCVNEQGKEQCRCNDGYKGDGTKCEDVDECRLDSAGCSRDADCINTEGSYSCKCLSGSTGDGFTCKKDPQCSQECGPDASCTEYSGSWQCVCNPGFQGDGLSCQPDGTCAGVQCSEHAQCLYAEDNSRKCVCNKGYQGDGQNCAPRDKCEGVTCGPNATCDATGKCACDQGFQGDGQRCDDVDECKESLHKCHSDADCTNTVGSYLCRCKEGYLGNGITCYKEEVSLLCGGQECHSQAQCLDSKCSCNSGYQGDGVTCADVNECLGENECDTFADCTNTNGSYTCACKDGYQGNGRECTKVEPGDCGGQKCHMYASCFEDRDTGKESCGCRLGFVGDGLNCKDLDECRVILDVCTDNKTACVNTLGSFECLCKKGFMEVNRKCVSNDTCMGLDCDPNAVCDPFRGCLCKPGYQGDGTNCEDEDECNPSRSPCDVNAACTNTDGSFQCQCKSGFTGDGLRCQRVDGGCNGVECDAHAQCVQPFDDQPFQCECGEGWQGDGLTCSDVNECEPFKNLCHPLRAECINTEGSYTCRCRPGFQGDGFNCTADGTCHGVQCHENATCFKPRPEVPGLCVCKGGWLGDGRSCYDIDECDSSKNSCDENANCINTEGSYRCSCKSGYQGDGFSCVSEDSCAGVVCDSNADCVSNEERQVCVCKNGWSGNGQTCFDVDECQPFKNDCHFDAECVNTEGSYECRCRPGYQGDGLNCTSDGTCEGITCDRNADCNRTFPSGRRQCRCKAGWQGDGLTCSDEDECQSFKNNCHLNAECFNTEGSYECRCRPGYLGNGFNCTSDGSCDGVFCDSNADCRLSLPEGIRKCICRDGWQGDGQNCSDIDECQPSKNNCHFDAECVNTEGSYECRCRPGYQGNGFTCVFLDNGTCEGITCDPNADCNRTFPSGRRQCMCKVGWQGDGRSCSDVNECQSSENNCHQKAECMNSAGSFECRCKPGYRGSGVNCTSDGSCDGVVCDRNAFCKESSSSDQRECSCNKGWKGNGTHCSDIDECESPEGKCDLNANCFNSPGSYRCRCRLGYQGNGTHCISDGTCDGVVCGQNSACIPRSVGSRERQCVCVDGWTGDGRSCFDIDECQAVNNSCHQHADCVNTLGSFSCRCKLGYVGSGFNCKSDGTCAGVVCHSNATCRNLIRGPTCLCKDGYRGSGTACADVDECQTSDNECHSNADCLNSIGSYSCQCKPGYQGNGFACKSDGTCAGVRCHPEATCEQNPRPVCVCKPGYEGDGRKCSDTDECLGDVQKCHQEAKCVNTVGSYNCSCKLGFEGDGYNCKPDGTCAGVVCALYADCVTTPSNARICECKAGFTGNGLECRDIDECAQLSHKCHKKAKCVNQPGSYVCRCKPGYYGSGFNCSSDGTCEGVVCDYNADCVTLTSGVDSVKECRCKAGFTGKGEICTDINECEDPSVCPDKADCYNMEGSFMCNCLPGYKKVGVTCRKDCKLCMNGGSCTENNTCLCPPGFSGKRCQWHGDASLIYSKGNSIQRMSLPPRPNNVGVIYQRAGAIHVGVDYDCVDQRVYWTEVTKGIIVRAKYDGSDMEVIVKSGRSTSPEGIAVDWLGRNIYWTDSRLDTIQVAKLNGTHRKTLISSDLGNPRAIVVDPPNGKMYWADWSRNRPKIEVANMDGSDRRVLVKSPLSLPNGLTLVHSTNELCYSDAGVWSISCVNLGDLSMRKAYSPAPYPFGITNFNRTLFWTDWKLGRIQRMGMNSKIPDKPLRSFVGSNGKIFDIKAVQPCGRTAASYENPCAAENGGCSSLCLLRSKSHSCSCPDGLHLVETGNFTRCEEKCDSALGMESGDIKDQQLSAHSAWNKNHKRYGASRARLYLNEWPQGWSAQKNDPSPWLQIDLFQIRTVTALATQGYGNKEGKEWVKTYVLMTSLDGERWISYREGGRKRVFIANVDTSSVVRNELKMPLKTRWLRIVPRSWNNHIGMRVELYGC